MNPYNDPRTSLDPPAIARAASRQRDCCCDLTFYRQRTSAGLGRGGGGGRGGEGGGPRGFLGGWGGRRGRFLSRDPTIRQPGIAYTPTVAGAGQSGGTLNTNGWPASSTPLFAGDFFSLGVDHQTRLYQLTADVISNASGLATLSFVPRLRASPTDGAALEIAAPAVLLRLTAPVPTRIGRADTFLFTLTAREAL